MFDQLITDAASRFNLSGTSVTSLVRGILSLMADERTGGPQGFVDLFRRAGLGDVVTSWFGGKEGRSITASEIESAIGTSAIDKLAGASGLPRTAASSALAFLLPTVIGRLTPNGVLPSASALLSQVSGFLDRPAAVDTAAVVRREAPGATRRWLPWAAAALLAIAGLLWMRGPAGTIDPQLSLSNREGKITYSGVVRDESTRNAVLQALRETFGAANVSGDLRVDRNVRAAAWRSRLGDLFAAVKKPGVDVALNGTAVSLGGWISPADRQALAAQVRNILGTQGAIGSLGDAPGEAVRAANDKALSALRAIGTTGVTSNALVDAMNLAIINFPTGSSAIPTESMDVILQSAEAIKRAPGAKIEIGGHTDSTGDPVSNFSLSQARADAVKRALVDHGVSSDVLTTKGYGNTQPRASNDTEYGRFQNRRIEYTVAQ